MKLSILMPAYNEEATLALAVKRVLDVTYPCEIELVVDDGSLDHTADTLAAIDDRRVQVHRHATNQGKGAAIRTAAAAATGDYLLPCDADLEYSPEEIPALLAPILAGDATLVFGTRSFSAHTAYSFWYVMGNRCVTLFANVQPISYRARSRHDGKKLTWTDGVVALVILVRCRWGRRRAPTPA